MKCWANPSGFFLFANKLLRKKKQIQLLGQQFYLAGILGKVAKCKLAEIQMLRLKPKGTITSFSLTFYVTQAHYISHSYSVLSLISNA